jgi:transposase InsO family protein
MREQGLNDRRKKSGMNTTESKYSLPVAENLLNREFRVCGTGEKWVSDIMYLRISSGWLYLTVILDLWDRTVIGWTCSEDLEAGHVCDALTMACKNRQPVEGLLFHSDRGVPYCSKEFREMLSAWCPQVRQRMSRKGNCAGLRLCEAFFQDVKRGSG